MLNFNFSTVLLFIRIYQLITQIIVAYVCFAVLSRRRLTQHRHLTTITLQLQTNFRIAPSFIYKRRCQLKDFLQNIRIQLNYYNIEDANEEYQQFQFFNGAFLTPTSNNLIIIIVLTVVVKYFQKHFSLFNVFV